MKKKIATLVTILLLLSMLNFSGSNGKKIELFREDGYALIKSDLPTLMVPASPMLPYEIRTYIFPFGTKINDIDAKPMGIEIEKIKEKIKPAPEPVTTGKESVVKEGAVYSKDEFYPQKWYDYSIKAGIKDGKHVIFVNIYLYPYRYNPVRNEIMHANNFDIKVDYSMPSKALFMASNYDLLIIAPSDWLADLQPFVEHKEMHGIRTKLVSIQQAEAMLGNDDAERIKRFIQYEIEHDGIKYVLLVGSAKIFPIRYSHVYDGEESQFVSDLYYADIYDADGQFSSWDTNNNGIYGEYKYKGNTDDVDLYPDVYVGRIACSNKNELNTVLNKIMEYEDSAYMQDWTNRVVVCGGDSHDDNDGVFEGEQIKNSSLNYLKEFSATRLYVSLGNLSKNSIIEEFNKGELLFNFAGHGNRLSWATHPPRSFNTWIGFSVADIYSMKNGDRLPVVILNACETGQFDQGTTLAWSLVASSGGAVATFATTALSWEYVGSYCDKGLSGQLDVLFCKHFEKGKFLGDVFYAAKEDYLRMHFQKDEHDYKTIEEWELFGDPTLVIGGYGGENVPRVRIKYPYEGYIYIGGKQIMPSRLGKTIVIGKIDVEVEASNITKVEFYFDNELKYTDEEPPFEWTLDETAFFSHEIKVIGYGNESTTQDSMNLIIFNI